MKRIIVTGGAGFIGIHLCKRLLEEGNEVVCLDNYATGSHSRATRLVARFARFRPVCHDVTVPYETNHVDEIYNLACPASPMHYSLHPVETLEASVYGAANMLALATRCGAKMLQASTSEVYGCPEVHPQAENYWGRVNPVGPRACYDEGKRAAEALCMDYHRQYGTRVKIVRIFNTYGPGMAQDDGRVVSNFIVQALQDMPLTIYGDGRQTRSFMYVDDLVEALLRAMATDGEFTGPVNLGNPVETGMRQLAETVIALTGTQAGMVYRPLPVDDPQRRKPDITLTHKGLDGWQPVVPLEEGLKRTIAYFKELLKRAQP